jgi:hypothetical protein
MFFAPVTASILIRESVWMVVQERTACGGERM